MKKLFLITFWSILSLQVASAQTFKFSLQEFATGFVKPVDIESAGDGRLFVVEQRGTIRVLQPNGTVDAGFFLDMQDVANDNSNERGLLGLAFHPNFAQNGFFYVNYTDNSGGDTQISRFSVDPTDPGKALATSEFKILEIKQPYTNHNGGGIHFGPDGYLYIGMGDGGSGGDPQQNAQNGQILLGKMLRIDINTAPYVIPADNPFVNSTTIKPEIWTMGMRNPWRFSFDKLNGDLWIGDVGQNAREEIDLIPANQGGLNMGWRCREGLITGTAGGNCPPDSLFTQPVFEWLNPSIGCSAVGGFVYRGVGYPNWQGIYFCADYCSGRFWKLEKNAATNGYDGTQIANLSDSQTTAFGQDDSGRLYTTGHVAGKIYKLCSTFTATAAATNETCAGANNGAISLTINDLQGAESYNWSNGATTKDAINLPAGTYTVTVSDGNQCTVKATAIVANNSPVAPIATPLSSINLCPNSMVELTATAAPNGYVYQWQLNGGAISGANQANFVANAAGNYSVIFAGNCNSAASNLLAVTVSTPTPPTFSVTNNLLTIGAGFSAQIQWFLNGAAIPGANADTYQATQTGNYSVAALEPQTNCVATSDILSVTVVATDLPIGVQKLKISPNPFSDKIVAELDLNTKQSVKMTILDDTGKLILSKKTKGQHVSETFDLSHQAAGIYFLKIEFLDVSMVRQIVKG
jgi:glucose/arabinose dehydrogenase